MLRRQFLNLTAGAVAIPFVSRVALAQGYPSRPVRVIVTFPAGGANDIHARLHGQWLSERLGQAFVVENKGGGGGNIGVVEAIRSKPDGYTLLIMTAVHMIQAAAGNAPYDYIKDLTPIAGFYRSWYVMVINPSLPVRSVPEFIAYAKANPGKLNMASNGVGATGHLCGEMFKKMAGVDMLHVPYRGEGPALQDMIAGQVHIQFATATATIPLIKSGQVRALGTTGRTRATSLPDVPTISETLPAYELTTLVGLGAPAGVPPAVIDVLNREVNGSLARAEIREKYAGLDVEPYAGSAANFGTAVAESIQKFRIIIKDADIKL